MLRNIAHNTMHLAIWIAALFVVHLTVVYGVSEAVGMVARTYYNMRLIALTK